MKTGSKLLALLVCATLLVGCVVAGTYAWLIDGTEAVVNTFTVGNININLTETPDLDLKMIPGKELPKDPMVTVEKKSEECWLFVEILPSDNYGDFFGTAGFTVATGWTELTGTVGSSAVYYRSVAESTDTDQSFYVLADAVSSTADVGANGSVQVLTTVTKAMMDAIEADSTKAPKLTFTAYAIQKAGFATAAAAWAELKK